MLHPSIRREIAERYHRALPDEIRSNLKARGIPATITEKQLLGWNGERVTIPVFGREREVIGFRYARVSDNPDERPDVISDFGLEAELYGWEALERNPHRVVICAREFDRLLLEANGFRAVASTGGPATFAKEWLPHFESVKRVYICFDRDREGAAAARRLQTLIPRAEIATLPPEVGQGGSVSDFFVGLGRTRVDFELLLAAAADATSGSARRTEVPILQPQDPSMRARAERLRRAVRLHHLVADFTDLHASDGRLVGQCPFEEGGAASFSVDPASDTYCCSRCGAAGDVVGFLMDKESKTIGQALDALERFQFTHELYRAS
jgi:hypothetical protein